MLKIGSVAVSELRYGEEAIRFAGLRDPNHPANYRPCAIGQQMVRGPLRPHCMAVEYDEYRRLTAPDPTRGGIMFFHQEVDQAENSRQTLARPPLPPQPQARPDSNRPGQQTQHHQQGQSQNSGNPADALMVTGALGQQSSDDDSVESSTLLNAMRDEGLDSESNDSEILGAMSSSRIRERLPTSLKYGIEHYLASLRVDSGSREWSGRLGSLLGDVVRESMKDLQLTGASRASGNWEGTRVPADARLAAVSSGDTEGDDNFDHFLHSLDLNRADSDPLWESLLTLSHDNASASKSNDGVNAGHSLGSISLEAAEAAAGRNSTTFGTTGEAGGEPSNPRHGSLNSKRQPDRRATDSPIQSRVDQSTPKNRELVLRHGIDRRTTNSSEIAQQASCNSTALPILIAPAGGNNTKGVYIKNFQKPEELEEWNQSPTIANAAQFVDRLKSFDAAYFASVSVALKALEGA